MKTNFLLSFASAQRSGRCYHYKSSNTLWNVDIKWCRMGNVFSAPVWCWGRWTFSRVFRPNPLRSCMVPSVHSLLVAAMANGNIHLFSSHNRSCKPPVKIHVMKNTRNVRKWPYVLRKFWTNGKASVLISCGCTQLSLFLSKISVGPKCTLKGFRVFFLFSAV